MPPTERQRLVAITLVPSPCRLLPALDTSTVILAFHCTSNPVFGSKEECESMAAFDLPTDPAIDQRYTLNGVTYKWNGYGWSLLDDVPAQLATLQMGQCKLIMANTTTLRLIPYDGDQIMIAGTLRTIPAAGVTLAAGTFGSQVLYYIYASWNGTTVVLEHSTTGYQIVNGLRVKSADPSRTLVGMACIWTGSFEPAMVRSWFNEDGITVQFLSSLDQALTTPGP